MGKRGRKRGRPLTPREIAARHRLRSVGAGGEAEAAAWQMEQQRRELEALHPLVTFVIPTVGRRTLERALTSLLMQTNDRWTAILVGDGLQPAIRSPRYESVRALKCGSAGILRNIGMRSTQSKAPWFAFLDDDDEVTPDYVARLESETANPPGAGAALVLFRMLDKDGVVKPQAERPTLVRGWVGISFAVRREWPLDHGVEFIREEPSTLIHEDITYVNAVQEAGGVIHVVPEPFAYRVRGATVAGAP